MREDYQSSIIIPIKVLFIYNDYSTFIGDKNKFIGDTAIGSGKIER